MNHYVPDRQTYEDLECRFSYHAPIDGQVDRYTNIRDRAHEFAVFICMNAPSSRERALALTHLETTVMWANAAIARNE
jgi:hypothetical protein